MDAWVWHEIKCQLYILRFVCSSSGGHETQGTARNCTPKCEYSYIISGVRDFLDKHSKTIDIAYILLNKTIKLVHKYCSFCTVFLQ